MIPSGERAYPEISGGKHRFSVRFLDCADWEHPSQVDREVEFQLSTCLI
jgi:cell division protein ZapD